LTVSTRSAQRTHLTPFENDLPLCEFPRYINSDEASEESGTLFEFIYSARRAAVPDEQPARRDVISLD
jgi:hypothetical protein